MNIWHDISPENIKPENFTAVIEISKGSRCKYELDKETGINYLFCQSGYAGGLTPLLDRDGKPVVTPRYND